VVVEVAVASSLATAAAADNDSDITVGLFVHGSLELNSVHRN